MYFRSTVYSIVNENACAEKVGFSAVQRAPHDREKAVSTPELIDAFLAFLSFRSGDHTRSEAVHDDLQILIICDKNQRGTF